MARPSGPKVRCSGQWTESRFNSFVTSLLRQGTRRWGPLQEVKKAANVSRGIYECAECKEHVPVTVRDGRKRKQNTFVDHIDPIVDPAIGFTTWDEYINRIFCEEDNLQLICKACHDTKSTEERAIATERRKKERESGI
ncbi:MAG: HNH endonuclease [Crocinitomix sp.]|nr:HNH endonuclease [Crocinitomix sp.]